VALWFLFNIAIFLLLLLCFNQSKLININENTFVNNVNKHLSVLWDKCFFFQFENCEFPNTCSLFYRLPLLWDLLQYHLNLITPSNIKVPLCNVMFYVIIQIGEQKSDSRSLNISGPLISFVNNVNKHLSVLWDQCFFFQFENCEFPISHRQGITLYDILLYAIKPYISYWPQVFMY
jgi:hypothetical protein